MEKQEDDIAKMPMWKSYLYHLQQQAPKPKRITSKKDIPNRPPFYGKEYHGAISRQDADFLLTIGGEGAYLIRESQRAPGQYTLAIRFDGVTKNFKLYFDNQHYVGEKRFDAINDLVADGLITFYLESKAADYIASLSNQSNYAESPYMAFNTQKKQHKQRLLPQKQPPRPHQPQQNFGPVPARPPRLSQGPSNLQNKPLAPLPPDHPPTPSSSVSQVVNNNQSTTSPSRNENFSAKSSHIDKTRHSQLIDSNNKILDSKGKNKLNNRKSVLGSESVTHDEEAGHFPTPPSSPSSSVNNNNNNSGSNRLSHKDLIMNGQIKDNKQLSSVTWCNDYLEVMGCEKPHNFKLYTFKGPHWCDFCANFLWGLIAQGVKCQDCGFNAHKKCSEKVPNDCMPDMKYVKRIFSVDLTTLVKAQNTLLPVVVEMCIREIEKRGLQSEGLYRVAGFHDDVEAIRMAFDKDGDQTDISDERYDDVNTIASVLKLFFRLLPIPLITFDVYFKVIDIVKRDDFDGDKKLEQMKVSVEGLPPAHFHTLKYLISHLQRVTEKQQQNMMNAENLAIVFAPTLLRSPESDPLFSLTAVRYEREFIELLIINHKYIFD